MKEYTKFLLDTGGMPAWEQMTKEKAEMIYNVIDESKGFYTNEIYPKHRSRLNIPFRVMYDKGLEFMFLREARDQNMIDLEGYKGNGIRASIYNGVPYKGVEKLRDFMVWFQQKYS